MNLEGVKNFFLEPAPVPLIESLDLRRPRQEQTVFSAAEHKRTTAAIVKPEATDASRLYSVRVQLDAIKAAKAKKVS